MVFPLLVLASTIAVIGLAWYLACHWNSTYWHRRGIPGPVGKSVVFNQLDQMSSFDRPSMFAIQEWTKQFGPVYGILEGWAKVLIIADPEMAHELLVTKFEYFHGRKANPLVGNVDKEKRVHVFNARGARWKRLRAITSPSFSVNSLKKIFRTVDDSCRTLLKFLEKAADAEKPINVHPYFQELTMDVISRVALGQQRGLIFENPNTPLIKKVILNFGGTVVDRVAYLFPYLGSYIRQLLIPMSVIMGNPFKNLIGNVYSIVEQRKKSRANGITHPSTDFIDLFLDTENDNIQPDSASPLKVTHKQMSTEEIVAQCFVFLLAGFDTTSNALAITCYLLAQNPEIQDRLIEEIDEVCPEDDITFDQLSNLHYCEAVMKETLRLYPIAEIAASRECIHPTTLGNVHVEAGVQIQIDVLTIHRNRSVWGDDADEFVPERFFSLTSEQAKAFLSFGGGLRTCIGMRLAYLEEKLTLARILQHYRLLKVQETESALKLVGRTVLNPESVTLKLEKRPR